MSLPYEYRMYNCKPCAQCSALRTLCSIYSKIPCVFPVFFALFYGTTLLTASLKHIDSTGSLAVPDDYWRLAVPGGSWRFLAAPGGSWRLLATPGDSWRILAAPDSSWRLLAAPGAAWQLLLPLAAPGVLECICHTFSQGILHVFGGNDLTLLYLFD